jgi:uncharacterized protein (TIGR00297 family)
MLWKVLLRGSVIVALLARAKKNKSLTNAGLVTAVITGVVHSLPSTSLNIALLCAFFYSGTRFTKVKADIKKGITVHSINGNGSSRGGGEGPRNHVQVLSNSLIASLLAILQLIWPQSNVLAFGVIANYAAMTADTWSSELGILSSRPPVLITTLRPCPKGTNGGVSSLGLYMGLAGGLFIGLVSVVAWQFARTLSLFDQLGLVLGTGLVGLFGTVLDSVLGATLQKSVINKQGKIVEAPGGFKVTASKEVKVYSGSRDLLDNNQVNFSTASASAVIGMLAWALIHGF